MTITCPCGTTFEKAPGRGRPPKFCPQCRASSVKPSKTVSLEAGEPVLVREGFTPKGRIYDPHDTLTPEQRDRVEDGIEEVNFKYATEIVPFKDVLWPDLSVIDRSTKCLEWQHKEMVKVYESVKPRWWIRSGE